jgi:tetratricopeptide (TPR) repeat protein
VYLVAGLVVLAQLQVLVPIERPEAAAYQIRQLCPVASPRDRDRLVTLERRLADSVSAKQGSPDLWDALGCVRALQALNATLDRNDQIQAPIRISQAEGAVTALLEALKNRPDDAPAAELLAALSQHVSEDPVGGKAILLDDLAMAIHRAVQAGVTSPPVLRACTRLLIAVGDIATARECARRAMTLGSDSTWHLLRLMRVSLSDGDRDGAFQLFERAALAAHDSSAMNELLYPFFSEANWARWVAVPDTERRGWLRDSLFPDKLDDSVVYAARLEQQLAGSQDGGGRSFYWWCSPLLMAQQCTLPSPKGEAVITTAARFSRFWDVETGEPMALITFGVRVGDLVSEKDKAGRTAEIAVTIHTWDEAAQRWTDTTVPRQLRYPASTASSAFATGRIMIPTSLGVTSWAVRIAQAATRRGRAADDWNTPIGPGPIQLSDLLVGNEPQDPKGSNTGTGLNLSPFGNVKRSRPLQLLVQMQSDQDRPQVRVFAVLRPITSKGSDEPSALQFAFAASAKRGINTLSGAFSIAKLRPGSYTLQVLVLDEIIGTVARREITLQVE